VHPANVAGGERDLETIRRGIGKSMNGVRPEVVILSLLAIADYRRAGRLEACDCIPNGGIIKRIQVESSSSRAVLTASTNSSGRGMLPIGSVEWPFYSPRIRITLSPRSTM
jgi:hypothetical protein